MQAIEIGIFGRPIAVAVSGREAFLQDFERFCFSPKNAIGAGGIVERTGIAGAKGDGGLQVPHGLVRVFFKAGELGSQQDTGSHVFRHQFQLLAEGLDKSLLDVSRFFFPSQPFQRPAIGNIRIVVVTVRFECPLRQRRTLFETAGGKICPAEDIPGSFAVGLALDGALGQQRRFIVFLLRIEDAGVRHQHFRQIRRKRRSPVAGSQSPFKPFRVLVAKLVDESAHVSDSGVRQSEIRIQLDGLFEHLQRVVDVFAVRVVSAAQIKIVGLGILRGLARDDFFFLRRQRDAQGLGDAARDFLLDGEDILQLPVVTLGPDGMPRRGFDQLRGDAHAIARAADRTLEHVGCAELLAHLLRGYRLVPELEHLRAREDFELRDFRELRDDVFGDAVAEIFVLFRAALIFEVQHRD